MDLEVQVIDRHPVLDVAIEPVGLLDEDGETGRICLEEREHVPKAAPSGLLGRFDVYELANDRQVMLTSILVKDEASEAPGL